MVAFWIDVPDLTWARGWLWSPKEAGEMTKCLMLPLTSSHTCCLQDNHQRLQCSIYNLQLFNSHRSLLQWKSHPVLLYHILPMLVHISHHGVPLQTSFPDPNYEHPWRIAWDEKDWWEDRERWRLLEIPVIFEWEQVVPKLDDIIEQRERKRENWEAVEVASKESSWTRWCPKRPIDRQNQMLKRKLLLRAKGARVREISYTFFGAVQRGHSPCKLARQVHLQRQ